MKNPFKKPNRKTLKSEYSKLLRHLHTIVVQQRTLGFRETRGRRRRKEEKRWFQGQGSVLREWWSMQDTTILEGLLPYWPRNCWVGGKLLWSGVRNYVSLVALFVKRWSTIGSSVSAWILSHLMALSISVLLLKSSGAPSVGNLTDHYSSFFFCSVWC